MTTLTSTEDVPSLRRTLESLQRQHAALDAEERMLELKVEEKKGELKRSEARLQSVQSVRPSLVEEHNMLEKELARQYEEYVRLYQNLDYLEREVDSLRSAELAKQSRAERRIRCVQRRVQAEEERRQELVAGGGTPGKQEGGGGGRRGSRAVSDGDGRRRTKASEREASKGHGEEAMEGQLFVMDYGDEDITDTKALNNVMDVKMSRGRRTSVSQPSPPTSTSSASPSMEHLKQYGHPPPLANRKFSTASSILEMGAKRSSPSSLGEGEEEEDDFSFLPGEEKEDSTEDIRDEDMEAVHEADDDNF